MRILILISAITIAFSCSAQGDEFPYLKKEKIESSIGEEAYIGFNPQHFNFNKQVCTNLPDEDFLSCEEGYELHYKLGSFENNGEIISIGFTFGLSHDPEFLFVNSSNKLIGRVLAFNLYLLPNGFIYSSGHTNSMFDKKRKFQIANDSIIEVKQPYYYVGLKTITTGQFELYKSPNEDTIIASIPEGYEIEVLLALPEDDNYSAEKYYLIKTKFGLVGWIKVIEIYNTKVKGLFFSGD